LDKSDCLALFKEGKTAWNRWAHGMLEKRKKLQENGAWSHEGPNTNAGLRSDPRNYGGNAETRAWIVESAVMFDHEFEDIAHFDECIFPSIVCFEKSRFLCDASFRSAVFSNYAHFSRAVFLGMTSFEGATFLSDVEFERARFHREANFEGAQFGASTEFIDVEFRGKVDFSEAKFTGIGSFSRTSCGGLAYFSGSRFREEARFLETVFRGKAFFNGIQVTGLGNFCKASFAQSVSFFDAQFNGYSQFDDTKFEGSAYFQEAVFKLCPAFNRAQFLGNVEFERAKFFELPNIALTKFSVAPNFSNTVFPDASIGDPTSILAENDWRELRLLAEQRQDKDCAESFGVNEMISRRLSWAKPFDSSFVRYWFGICYWAISDFGRSVVRPILWWLAMSFGSALFYLSRYSVYAKLAGKKEWGCVNGQGEPLLAALYFSVSKGLVFTGIGDSEFINHAYACLFGTIGGKPLIPYEVGFFVLGQTVVSAILICMLVLAVRNLAGVRRK